MPSTTKENYWKYTLIILIALLGLLIIKELWPLVNGLLAAMTVFVLVRNQMVFLTDTLKIHKIPASILILLEVTAIIVVLVYLISLTLIGRLNTINVDISVLTSMINQFEILIKDKFNYDLMSAENITTLTGYLTRGVQFVINQAGGMVITFIVMLFLLYFMLVDFRTIEHYFTELLPFNEKNRNFIAKKAYNIVRSNAIGIPLIAILQGIIAYVGYLVFGVPSAHFFALLACITTIIPLVGAGLVWVPLVVYMAVTGEWYNAIGLGLCYLILVIGTDNVFRFVLQKRLADIHPLITVFGVILGLTVFGFWGIVFGPLLLSLFFLLINIFKREYLDTEKSTS
ncbi:MAG: AI-2E family transporter [Tannerella sp.]|jgi:predicted PurR-regulated permease PerM|nr:AI-2E family transporter [Tannerella sp.]